MPAAARFSVPSALAYAKAQDQRATQDWDNQCLAFVRSCWGLGATGIYNARQGYGLTKKRHKDRTPPPAAPCWFRGPTDDWHVTLAKSNGSVFSNDIKAEGKIDVVSIGYIEDRWNCDYLGWSEDYPKASGSNVKLPLDLIDDLDYAAEFRVGQHVVVSTRAGLKARSAPGTESSTLIHRKGKLLTVAYGYGIHLTKITEEDGILWGKGAEYTYALADRNKAFVKLVR